MKRTLAWLVVPLLALVVWLVLRDRGSAARASRPSVLASQPAGATSGAPAAARETAATRSAAPATSPSPPTPASAGATHTGDPAPSAPSASPASRPPRAEAPAPPHPVGEPPRDRRAPADELIDRTGWGDASVAKQLNRELMPLVSECIDQARARKPGLRGLLGFTMVIAPTENGRAIVASLQLRKDNQIQDPELFECIRESSFSLEGLTAPHDFDITMPIEPEANGR